MMNAYQNLAASYDRLTNDVDYEGWVDFAQAIVEREGLHPRTVADLACGTGVLCRILHDHGIRTAGYLQRLASRELHQNHLRSSEPKSSLKGCELGKRTWVTGRTGLFSDQGCLSDRAEA